MPKRYNTPHRSRVVKTRLSEDEYADFTERLAPYGISQSEFLRHQVGSSVSVAILAKTGRNVLCRIISSRKRKAACQNRLLMNE